MSPFAFRTTLIWDINRYADPSGQVRPGGPGPYASTCAMMWRAWFSVSRNLVSLDAADRIHEPMTALSSVNSRASSDLPTINSSGALGMTPGSYRICIALSR